MSQGIDIRNLLQQKQQQEELQKANKANAVMGIALQLFLHSKADSIADSFILAEEFITQFENRYLKEPQ